MAAEMGTQCSLGKDPASLSPGSNWCPLCFLPGPALRGPSHSDAFLHLCSHWGAGRKGLSRIHCLLLHLFPAPSTTFSCLHHAAVILAMLWSSLHLPSYSIMSCHSFPWALIIRETRVRRPERDSTVEVLHLWGKRRYGSRDQGTP